jgi:hypothetical protein
VSGENWTVSTGSATDIVFYEPGPHGGDYLLWMAYGAHGWRWWITHIWTHGGDRGETTTQLGHGGYRRYGNAKRAGLAALKRVAEAA